MRHYLKISLITCCLLLSSCAEIELASHFGKKIAGSAQSKGYYKVGSPYTIKGVRYYPAIDYKYDKRGVASWYGPGFHGKQTANGEIYDQTELTAAHKTLPLPSIVRVTNLENGKSLIVRVNDRGPYAHGRIIDMSKRSAELLGFKRQGVAKVRVQVLEAESRMVAQVAKDGKATRGMEIAMNKSGYKPKVTQIAKVQPPKVQQHASLTTPSHITTPGHVKGGNFYPDSVVSEYPVAGKRGVFVQTGAFSTRTAAMKQAGALDSFGRAQIHPVSVDSTTYYRVRFPTRSVAEADALLEGIMARGHNSARIIVD